MPLKELIGKGMASAEIEGKIVVLNQGQPNEIFVDEHVINVSRPAFCQYTGVEKDRCHYSLAVTNLKEVAKACHEQIAGLSQQIEILRQAATVIDDIIPAEDSSGSGTQKKPSKASR